MAMVFFMGGSVSPARGPRQARRAAATIDHFPYRSCPDAARASPGGGVENGAMKTLDGWSGWLALATLLVAWSFEARWLMPH
jgi:hypothetical protein